MSNFRKTLRNLVLSVNFNSKLFGLGKVINLQLS